MKIVPPNQKDDIEGFLNDIKYILLDFDNTLVDYNQGQNDALKELITLHDVTGYTFEQIQGKYNEFNNHLWAGLENGNTSITEIRETRFRRMQEEFGFKGQPLAIDLEYLHLLIKHTKVRREILDILKEIGNAGIRSYIVTNGIDWVQKGRIELTHLDKYTEGYVSSEMVGKAKPGSDMFDYAIKSLNANKMATLMIGDSLKSDVRGANNFGLKSCWLSKSANYNFTDEMEIPTMISPDIETILDYVLYCKRL